MKNKNIRSMSALIHACLFAYQGNNLKLDFMKKKMKEIHLQLLTRKFIKNLFFSNKVRLTNTLRY